MSDDDDEECRGDRHEREDRPEPVDRRQNDSRRLEPRRRRELDLRVRPGRNRDAETAESRFDGIEHRAQQVGGIHVERIAHDPDRAVGVVEPDQRPMRRDDEVAHYLSRARRRLEAGDVTAAQSLLDAALDMTRTP